MDKSDIFRRFLLSTWILLGILYFVSNVTTKEETKTLIESFDYFEGSEMYLNSSNITIQEDSNDYNFFSTILDIDVCKNKSQGKEKIHKEHKSYQNTEIYAFLDSESQSLNKTNHQKNAAYNEKSNISSNSLNQHTRIEEKARDKSDQDCCEKNTFKNLDFGGDSDQIISLKNTIIQDPIICNETYDCKKDDDVSITIYDHSINSKIVNNQRKLNYFEDEIDIFKSDLVCKPDVLGYTPEEGSRIFPNIKYPRCDSQYKSGPGMMDIDYPTNRLTMNCSGSYMLGQISENFKLYTFQGKLLRYNGPVNLSSQEWAFGTCDNRKISDFEHVVYKLRPNVKALERAKSKLKTKPINFIMLTFDSLSRRSAFRKLPKTIEFLNNLNPKFSLFDFKLHHVIDRDSMWYFTPMILGGLPIKDLYNLNKPIWSYLHENGFVTLFGTDICDLQFNGFLGDNPPVDHIMGSIWCAAKSIYGYDQSLEKQRCLGNKNVHTIMMDYLLEFSEYYKNVSRFTYLHINTGHENTGTVIGTLDEDLVDFLSALTDRDEDTILFVKGDHGMRYGAWQRNTAGMVEHRLPATFLVVSNSFLKNIPESNRILKINENRLISSFDFYNTIMNMAHYPKFVDLSGYTYTKLISYNIFNEIIPSERTCQDILVGNDWCACLPVKYLEIHELSGIDILKLTEKVIDQINIINAREMHHTCDCKHLTLNKLLEVGELADWKNGDRFYKIKYNVNEDDYAIFKVDVKLSKQFINHESKWDPFSCNEISIQHFKFFKILWISRPDNYLQNGSDQNLTKIDDPVMCLC